MSGKNPIDLSRIPAPDVVEALDYETVFTEMRDALLAMAPELSDTLALESEPLTKLLQVCAYRELLLRQRVNEASRGVMLPYALGADLDNLGALFGVERLLIGEGDAEATPPIPPTYENDDELRLRIQLALDGLSTAGPARAYIYHALSASGEVLDASVDTPTFARATVSQAIIDQLPANSIVLQVGYDAGLAEPMPGDVVVTVLSRDGNGTPSGDVLEAVDVALNSESVRPLTDNVHTQSASVVDFTIDAALYTYPGPDTNVVLATAQAGMETYLEENKRLGRSITRSGVFAALHVAGVQRVELTSPAADVNCTVSQAANNTGITITHGGSAI